MQYTVEIWERKKNKVVCVLWREVDWVCDIGEEQQI